MIMTERRLLLEAEDILYIRMTCRKCKAVQVTPIDGQMYLWPRCSACGIEWHMEKNSPEDHLLAALRGMRQRPKRESLLQLELLEPD